MQNEYTQITIRTRQSQDDSVAATQTPSSFLRNCARWLELVRAIFWLVRTWTKLNYVWPAHLQVLTDTSTFSGRWATLTLSPHSFYTEQNGTKLVMLTEKSCANLLSALFMQSFMEQRTRPSTRSLH